MINLSLVATVDFITKKFREYFSTKPIVIPNQIESREFGFFFWDLNKGKVVLADRGQGILATLKRAEPELKNHQDALLTAFTKVISGRAPEYRGNGLKFVKDVVVANKISLFFQTGDAWFKIQKNDSNIDIQKSAVNFRGCLAVIKF